MTARLSIHRANPAIGALLALVIVAGAPAQTKIEAPRNGYSVEEDVKLGQEAAAEVRKELPLLTDERVDDWIEGIGGRLAAGCSRKRWLDRLATRNDHVPNWQSHLRHPFCT